MALTVSDLQDLIRLLDEHPDWKAELRRRLIDDEWAELRADIRALVIATQAHEKRLDDIDERLRQLVATAAAHEKRLDDIDERLRQLVATAAAHEKRLDDIDERLRQLAETAASILATLEAANTRADRHENRLGKLDGRMLEIHFRDHIYAYFGSRLRRIRLETLDSLPGLLDAYDAGRISQLQWRSLARLDAIVSGVPHDRPDRALYIALEFSVTIDDHDVERAVTGANLLKSLGYDAVAAVGGDAIRDDVRPLAAAEDVMIVVGDEIADWPASA